MDLILQGHFQTEAQRKGVTVVQVRAVLRGLGPLLHEVPIAFANRFAACVQVYSRMALPELVEDTIKTKARRLLLKAGLKVPAEFEGPEESFSLGSPKKENDTFRPRHRNGGILGPRQPSRRRLPGASSRSA